MPQKVNRNPELDGHYKNNEDIDIDPIGKIQMIELELGWPSQEL